MPQCGATDRRVQGCVCLLPAICSRTGTVLHGRVMAQGTRHGASPSYFKPLVADYFIGSINYSCIDNGKEVT